MLTPQEVQEKKFKQAFVGGYDMAAVDEFLEIVTGDYTNLFKENAVLKNKMKVLVEKIEEYRENDDSIRQAYLAIKRQAEKELEDTRGQVSRLMDEATGELNARRDKLAAEVSNEEKRLELAREQTVTFVSALRELYSSQMDKLSMIPDMEIKDSPRQKRDAAIQETVQAIGLSLAPELEEAGEPEDVTTDLQASTLQFNLEKPDGVTAVSIDDLRKKQEEILESFEVSFAPGTLDEDIWEREQDTEVPRPKFDFPDLEKQFGPEAAPAKAKRAK